MTPKRFAQIYLFGMGVLVIGLSILAAANMKPTLDFRASWKTRMVKRAMPAIVQIEVLAQAPVEKGEDGEELPREPDRHWWGSGAVVTPDGLVLSAYHVLAMPGYKLTVTAIFSDGHKEPLVVVKLWKAHDLALARLPRADAPRPFLEVSKKDPLIGEEVLAMGNPFALGHSVSSGIVSALGRKFYLRLENFPVKRWVFVPVRRGQETPPPGATQMVEMIQFDAPLNPGNSGGALLDIEGKLIGQTNAGMPGDGIGFAVPAKFIRQLLADYLKQSVK